MILRTENVSLTAYAGILRKKDVQYNLRTNELCNLPPVSSQSYGLNSLSFRGNLLWNTIDDEMKLSPSLEIFKRKNVAGMAVTVHVFAYF